MQNNRERSAELAAAPGSAKFLPDGEGHSLRSDEGEVAVWSGKTTDTGQECYAVKMPHKSGNKHIFLLSRARATLLGNLLLTAINRNSQNAQEEDRKRGFTVTPIAEQRRREQPKENDGK
jgi:hypothetical protein